MKKLNVFIGILALILITACSSDSNSDDNQNPNNVKLLKQISWDSGYSEKYFYDAQDRLELIVHYNSFFDNIEDYDSTFIEYTNNKISKILLREQDGYEIINTEKIFLEFSNATATGTRKIFTDSGDEYMNQTFEYVFSGKLLKSYTTYNLNGNIHFVQEYNHNADGNLIEFNEISYDSTTGDIVYEHNDEITQWDEDKKVTEKLFSWDANSLPGFFLSNNNCLNLLTEFDYYAYEFDYDEDDYVIKYTLTGNGFFTLEYYD